MFTSNKPSSHNISWPFQSPETLTPTYTNNYDESLVTGMGGFGNVYKVNIKRIDCNSIHEPNKFREEVNMLATLRHANIVPLVRYCDKEKTLIYECVSNKTLDDHLHKYHTHLSWLQRLKVCIDVALGLRFLHHVGSGIESGVIHGDLKSSNVLLNESWEAKISDFGLWRTWSYIQPSNTCVIDNFGYLDPVYFETGRLRRKSDVYSLGVLLLEVLCRRRVLSEELYEEGENLVTWAQTHIKKGNLKHIVDRQIWDEISPKCLKKFITIVDRCLEKDLELRPTMAEVVANLEVAQASQKKFNASWRRRRNDPCSRQIRRFSYFKLSCIHNFLDPVQPKLLSS
ncbi:hypothetical protein QVD17_02600 [Tagetes erecta]|uniref:Protein kinase domain-containing protein n=1 Tax=Tagetes erecta TaxID=13708 RepID=A0AAD8P9B7_TARER|nr:hypothetical protein QVD17_02600 [Tagetes erecta]